MKNITLIIILICCGNIFAQQKVNIINGSSYDIFVSYVVTKDLNDEYPQLMSMDNGIIVPAGTTYSASDAGTSSPFKFPYNAFTGITQWLLSRVGPISSSVAYNFYGTTQKFYFAKISTHDNSLPIADGGDIGPAQPLLLGTYVNFQYSEIALDPLDPSAVIYNILAF